MTQKKLLFAMLFVLAFIIGSTGSRAQDGIKRTDLQTHDLSIPGREVVQQMVELQPGTLKDGRQGDSGAAAVDCRYCLRAAHPA